MCKFPFIDNELKFGSTSCYHDGYNLTRQDKINLIANYSKKTGKDVFLRVCFSPKKGKNCNRCEKCMRTIMALTATLVGREYQKEMLRFGFVADEETYCYIKKYLNEHLLYHTAHWKAIQQEFRKNKLLWQDDANVSWILDFKFNRLSIYFKLFINKIGRILKRK